MAQQPKACICDLDAGSGFCEATAAQLAEAGFAVALASYKEVDARQNGWMGLFGPEVLLFAGTAQSFGRELLCRLALLGLSRPAGGAPLVAFALCAAGALPELPPLLSHVRVYPAGAALGPKLAAARFKRPAPAETPFHVRSYPDPYTGLWLEVGPADGEEQADFMVGVLEADITAFGIGPAGGMPERSTLSYPLRGIKGELGGQPFTACAAKDALNADSVCYMKVAGLPAGILLGVYPGEDEEEEVRVLRFLGQGE